MMKARKEMFILIPMQIDEFYLSFSFLNLPFYFAFIQNFVFNIENFFDEHYFLYGSEKKVENLQKY